MTDEQLCEQLRGKHVRVTIPVIRTEPPMGDARNQYEFEYVDARGVVVSAWPIGVDSSEGGEMVAVWAVRVRLDAESASGRSHLVVGCREVEPDEPTLAETEGALHELVERGLVEQAGADEHGAATWRLTAEAERVMAKHPDYTADQVAAALLREAG
jgi:hypothetical protein